MLLVVEEQHSHNLKIDFNAFVNKDFELTNLMFLPSKDTHLKCGILDFQNILDFRNCLDVQNFLDLRIFDIF